jgi:hypothetical protein
VLSFKNFASINGVLLILCDMIVAKELIVGVVKVTAMEFHTVVRIRVVVCGLAHNFYFCNYVFFLKKYDSVLAISLSPTGHRELDRENCFINTRSVISQCFLLRILPAHSWSGKGHCYGVSHHSSSTWACPQFE